MQAMANSKALELYVLLQVTSIICNKNGEGSGGDAAPDKGGFTHITL